MIQKFHDLRAHLALPFKLSSLLIKKKKCPVRDKILVKTETRTINDVPSGTQYIEKNIPSLTGLAFAKI